jgi:hypothetical protein
VRTAQPLPQREHLALQVAEANTVKAAEAKAVQAKVVPVQAQAEHKQERLVSRASSCARLKFMSQICTKAMPS